MSKVEKPVTNVVPRNGMTFKKGSIPKPSLGEDYSNEVSIVVPDQAMSLEEILDRFVRGEELPVGLEVNDGEESDNPLNVDLEKLKNSDLVDKAEFIEKLRDVQKQYDIQEKAKADAEAKRRQAEYEAKDKKRIQMAARKLAKESLAKKA